jgi:FimV-like protein
MNGFMLRVSVGPAGLTPRWMTWLVCGLTLIAAGAGPLRAQPQEAAGRAPESKVSPAIPVLKPTLGGPQLPAREPAQSSSGLYRVRPGDSLGGIANELIAQELANPATAPAEKPSVAQRMLAIYRANPKAFAGSMHQLLEGVELRLPTALEIAAVDPGLARLELRDQTSEYLAEQARAGNTSELAPASEAEQALTGLQRALRRKDRELAALRSELDNLRLSPSGAVGGPAAPGSANVQSGSPVAAQSGSTTTTTTTTTATATATATASSLTVPNAATSRSPDPSLSPLIKAPDPTAAASGGVFSPLGLAVAGAMALMAGLFGQWFLRRRGRDGGEPAFGPSATSAPSRPTESAVTEVGAWKEAEILQRMPDLSGFSGLGSSKPSSGESVVDGDSGGPSMSPSSGPGRVLSGKGP